MHDVEAVFAIRSDERVMQYIGKPRAKEIKDSVELIARLKKGREGSSSITWGITTKNDPTLIGMIGYHRIQPEHYRGEIGYTLHADHWRKGIMSEAMKAVVAHGFGGLGFHSIEARTDPKGVSTVICFQRKTLLIGMVDDPRQRNSVLEKSIRWPQTK